MRTFNSCVTTVGTVCKNKQCCVWSVCKDLYKNVKSPLCLISVPKFESREIRTDEKTKKNKN